MEMKKEQAIKLKHNNKQVGLGKSYKIHQPKMLNPMNNQYLGQRKINPLNSNFHHPVTSDNNGKLLSVM